ncbi:MAG: LutB/LldF family L-lactate oxidation iron-sulfur protein [Bacteroidales bacterium]
MNELHKRFIHESEKIAFDKEHRRKINFNISKYDAAVVQGKRQYKELELARRRAASIKHKVIENLDKYLNEFETHFERNGGKVIWAQTAEEAIREIVTVLKKHEVKMVVKSKSMITEEVELNPELEKEKIESIETDLGEYIVQVAGEKPYHIVTPAMHKSKEDIARLFNEKFQTPAESTPEELTAFVRTKLRENFLHADAGITGANFLIADTGSIALTENEGNGMLSFSLPKIHIAVAGIEKIIPSIRDLDLFWPLLATHGTGQHVTVYNSIVSGPRQNGEVDGPAEMYVVLLDNGRSNLLAHPEQRQALSCIKCGACLNACPLYKNIGGYTYNATYTGPIGAVIAPYFKGMKEYKHLSFASSLCGKCTEVCPVKINLHELLLKNRRDAVQQGHVTGMEKTAQYIAKKALLNRWMMDAGGAAIKNAGLRMFMKKAWGPRRTLPRFAEKSFRQLWEERRGEKK